MKIVFNTFRSVSPKIFDVNEHLGKVVEENNQNYAYHILLPLYKVCEGFAGKVIPGKFSVCVTLLTSYFLGGSFGLLFLIHKKITYTCLALSILSLVDKREKYDFKIG